MSEACVIIITLPNFHMEIYTKLEGLILHKHISNGTNRVCIKPGFLSLRAKGPAA